MNNKKVVTFFVVAVISLMILSFLGSFFDIPFVGTIFPFAIFGIMIFTIIYVISSSINRISNRTSISNNMEVKNMTQNTEKTTIFCPNCGAEMKITNKFCTNCGKSLEGFNKQEVKQKEIVHASMFDSIYSQTEDKMLEEFINREIAKTGVTDYKNMYPGDIIKRKNILGIIFAVLVFVYISLIFFHFPIYTYLIGAIILLIFFIKTRKYDFMKFMKKEVKSRPGEKISNIVMNVTNSLMPDKFKALRIVAILVGLVLPLVVFWTPKIWYEHTEGGYAVRYYIFGLTNFSSAEIPEKYNGEDVVSLRGNTFSNMFFLEKVILPDTVTEIRGQAFKNCSNLREVNIPSKLEYLGGGAFYNCSTIKKIELPDTLTYLGGETFYGAASLEEIKLSNNLTEIRGNTFENCYSLKYINIPDGVTRIGGHAFYSNKALSKVIFTNNSKLTEIGSSAFRECKSLKYITLPKGVSVNSKAFKNSPTTINYF